ncbi:type I DNA topoisomerase [Roseiterribacter gracilis]|uniref:DNA topoisomerase 1 n=1 Tax=Roseiterribacter gracilis TaxID=2812848 RepID=A0A8S8X9M8_9PROT|nr:DNA topoisomerase 1 [Rhodospirillales bacterium TMPK1]
MSKNVVIVESPAKAKTINKYLGDDFVVLASYGHVRDLPARDGSVRPDEDFAMDWELGDRAGKNVDAIAKAVKAADHVFLATDPDREGEAISWHVQEILRSKKLLETRDVQRVTFNEITKRAVQEAFTHPRQLDRPLIDAYLARRALDYLVGFTLSPVLWRKLPGSKSAGRVQSVALRLICQREQEIESFKPQEYWTIEVEASTDKGTFVARLTELDGKKLDKFALPNEAAARDAARRIEAGNFKVGSVERKQQRRNPYPPFITSTLQMEASRKLGLSATKTMRTAQGLYEGVEIGGETVGLITYMRTDGVTLSGEAISQARGLIGKEYGDKYVPAQPRVYKSTAKNAQEAHEAIRPTDLSRRPQDVARYLDADAARLYELIWKRTVASQMESAVFDQVAVDIPSADGKISLRATGQTLVFDGFLTLYREDRDDPVEGADEEESRRLPPMEKGDAVKRGEVKPEQHFTQPPPRFSEASLVKRLEELGIGRPSTYASIMQVLQDRQYVTLDKKRFQPTDRGRLVTAFLENFFPTYVAYDFTADLEGKLDSISAGELDWKKLLREFWTAFSAAIGETKDLKISDVISALDEELGPHLFPQAEGARDPRVCPTCGTGRLSLKLGKFGAFVGCSNYPECNFTRPLVVPNGEGGDADQPASRELGTDPASGLMVTLRRGPYGSYVQLGEANKEDKKAPKPKRASLPKGLPAADVDLEKALSLLALPRPVGTDPNTNEEITAGIGRFGPYVKRGPVYKSLTAGDDVLTIGMNRAIELLANAGAKGAGRGQLRELGLHPDDQVPVTLHSGRYGPYVKHGKTMASLPRGVTVEEATLDGALPLLAAKAKPGKAKPAAKKAAAPKKDAAPAKKTAPAKKAADKKSTAKKTAAKKTAAKKAKS